MPAIFPLRTIWFVLTNGGSTPTYAVVAPRAGLGEMAPSPSLLEVLEKQLGKPAADALVKSFFDNVVSVEHGAPPPAHRSQLSAELR